MPNHIIPPIYNANTPIERSEMTTYRLSCTGRRCVECAASEGLLRECPVCGAKASHYGSICIHSSACNDHRYQHGYKFYVSRIEVSYSDQLLMITGPNEDDII